jgi:hypothetical protein
MRLREILIKIERDFIGVAKSHVVTIRTKSISPFYVEKKSDNKGT